MRVSEVKNNPNKFQNMTEYLNALYNAYRSEIAQGDCPHVEELYKRSGSVYLDSHDYAIFNALFKELVEGTKQNEFAMLFNGRLFNASKIKALYALTVLNRAAKIRNGELYRAGEQNAQLERFRTLLEEKREEVETLTEKNKDYLVRANNLEDECNRLRATLEAEHRELDRLINEKNKWRTNMNASKDLFGKSRKRIHEFEQAERQRVTREIEEQRDTLLKNELSGYIDDLRNGWQITHGEFEEDRIRIATEVSDSKQKACEAASEIQRDMTEYTNTFIEKLGASLDSWKNSLYTLQLEEFANWAAKFFRLVSSFDRRMINGVQSGETVELAKVSRSLNSLCNSLDKILPELGLRSYYAVKGEDFDPVYHAIENESTSSTGKIAECNSPGIEHVAVNGQSRVLVKAEVILDQEE